MTQLNLRNKYLTTEDVEKIFFKGGIKEKCNKIELYQRAFTHKSYTKDDILTDLEDIFDFGTEFVTYQGKSNERLEFLGDSFYNYVICDYLYRRYEDKTEAFLSHLKTRLISREYLSKFAKYLDLGEFVLLSNFVENLNGRNAESILEDTMEAFVFAMVEDLGADKTKKFLFNVIDENVDFAKIIFNNENYKDRIKKYTQKKNIKLQFKEILVLGQPNNRTYIVGCFFDGNLMNTGFGKIKKDAEHAASYKILVEINGISLEEQIFVKNNTD